MPHAKVKPARESTNALLGTERKKTDDELATRVSATDRKADDVLHAARERAEQVLGSARQLVDDSSQTRHLSMVERTAIEEERARDDEVLRQEHARADDTVVSPFVWKLKMAHSPGC